jgi:hypothetical protein
VERNQGLIPMSIARLIAMLSMFSADRVERLVPAGATISEMIEIAGIKEPLVRHAQIWIGEAKIERRYWANVRPKAGTQVVIKAILAGGEGGGEGKSTGRTIATLAVMIRNSPPLTDCA